MLSVILIATFIVMLGFIWFNEGWKKALKIIGLWFGSFIVVGLICSMLGLWKGNAYTGIFGLLLWGLWAIGLVIYNLKEGHIGNF